MITSVFKQLCLVTQSSDVQEVCPAILMAGSNAAQVAVEVIQFVGGGGGEVVVAFLQQSNDLENWTTIDTVGPLEMTESGAYMMDPCMDIATVAVRVAVATLANGHDVSIVVSADVTLTKL